MAGVFGSPMILYQQIDFECSLETGRASGELKDSKNMIFVANILLQETNDKKRKNEMQVKFRVFKPTRRYWNDLFQDAAKFATSIGPQHLINISHSCDDIREGVVTVWYWSEGESEEIRARESLADLAEQIDIQTTG